MTEHLRKVEGRAGGKMLNASTEFAEAGTRAIISESCDSHQFYFTEHKFTGSCFRAVWTFPGEDRLVFHDHAQAFVRSLFQGAFWIHTADMAIHGSDHKGRKKKKKTWAKRSRCCVTLNKTGVNKRWYWIRVRRASFTHFPAPLRSRDPTGALNQRGTRPARKLRLLPTTAPSLLTLRALSWLNNKHRTNPSLHFHQTLMSLGQPLSPYTSTNE